MVYLPDGVHLIPEGCRKISDLLPRDTLEVVKKTGHHSTSGISGSSGTSNSSGSSSAAAAVTLGDIVMFAVR